MASTKLSAVLFAAMATSIAIAGKPSLKHAQYEFPADDSEIRRDRHSQHLPVNKDIRHHTAVTTHDERTHSQSAKTKLTGAKTSTLNLIASEGQEAAVKLGQGSQVRSNKKN